MMRLVDIGKAASGRKIRRDDWDELGLSTLVKIDEALDEGRTEEARELAKYTITESKGLHDLMCDWVWDLLTQIANLHGEDDMVTMLQGSQETWMMQRTWKGYLRMSVEERVHLTAEILRSHRCGPKQDGELEIRDMGDHYRIGMDPCGSGGRMRRGDVVDGTPSRLGPPYNFGRTQTARPESWSKKDVPYYCLHCTQNEILPMKWGGHPLWVTDYQDDAAKPCAWLFYKKAAGIPEEYYTRVGASKPRDGEGQY